MAPTEDLSIERAQSAFERGDFASARRMCRQLQSAEHESNVSRQASELRKKMGGTATEAAILGGCMLFFMYAVWRYFL